MRLIGIVAAHGVELRPVLRHVTGRRTHQGIVFGRLRGCPVALQAVGQGWSRAYWAAIRFFEVTHCAGVVITGFAGATEAGWAVGDLLMPDKVMDLRHDEDGRDGPSYRPPFPVSSWRTQLGFRGGVLGTVAGVVVEPWDKAQLGSRLGVAAVDLETAAVAAVATHDGVPWVAARVILDPADRPLGVVSVWHAALLAVSVTGWGRLMQFGRDLAVAQRRLGDRIGDVVEIADQALASHH